LSFLLLLLQCWSFAALGVRRDGSLDTDALQKVYEESEFNQVRDAIENYMREHKDPKREEKIFAFKYLGVIYAADSVTRTRSESYFNRLLELSPNIELVDMFASTKIQEFFEKVKRDFQARKQYKSRFNNYGDLIAHDDASKQTESVPARVLKRDSLRTLIVPARNSSLTKKSKIKVWPWVLGAAAVGAGVGVYILTQQSEPEATPNRRVGTN